MLIEYTEDESPRQELEEGLRSKSCDLDTNYMLKLLVTYYCDTIIRHILVFQNLLPILLHLHCPQFSPLPLTVLVVSYSDQMAGML